MSEILNIAICGLVSSGKSSLLNALSSMFISSSSKNRDTFCPTLYELRINGNIKNGLSLSNKVNKTKLNNKKNFEEFIKSNKSNNNIKDLINNINKKNLNNPIKANFNANIVDFPGFGDVEGCSKDGETDFFLNSLLKNSTSFDLILFVCDSNSPFLTKEQTSIFNKIKNQIKINYNENQIYTELFVVATKYDCDGDEEIDEMWKNKHINLDIPKENIFFINNYQLFVSNMSEYLYIPYLCKQEFINIYKFICGNKKKPLHIDICNKTCKNNCDIHICNKIIKSEEFISNENRTSDTNGDKNNLIERLKEFSIGLNNKRTKPYYDKLINILTNVCTTMCPYSIINDNLINEIFKKTCKMSTLYKDDIVVLCNRYDIYSYLDTILNLYNTHSINSCISNLYKECIYDKLLVSIICKKYLQKNIPYSINENINSKLIIPLSNLNKINKIVYEQLSKYFINISKSKYYTEKLNEFLKENILSTKCIITCQFLKYLYVNNEDKEFTNKYINYIYSKALKDDINYIYLLNDYADNNNISNVLNDKQMIILIKLLRNNSEYDGLDMNFESFKYNKEYLIIVCLTRMSFKELNYLKYMKPITYNKFKNSISKNLFKRIEYCLSNIMNSNKCIININDFIYPKVYTYTEIDNNKINNFVKIVNSK